MKMKLKKCLKNVMLILGICLLYFFMLKGIVYAATTNELKAEKSEIEEEIEDTEEQLDGIQEELSDTMQEINELIDQISDYESEISELDDQIEDANQQIEEAETQIEEKEAELEEKQEMLEKRLVALYKAGSSSYLDVLLSSASITDFISNYYLIEQLAEYDTELIESVQAAKESLEESKVALEESKEELEDLKTKQEAKKNALATVKKEKEAKASNLTSEEEELKDQLEELAEANKSIDQQIKAAQEAVKQAAASYQASGGTSSSGFIWPTSTAYSITTGLYYSNGSYHGGVDISGSGISGTPVYAVADGYVVLSKALVNSSGSYYSYGNYVLIYHYNGLYTLYAHMSSRAVSTGDTVTQGQVIGYVGSTGNSTGPHLHFEVRTGSGTYSERVNPLNYLP